MHRGHETAEPNGGVGPPAVGTLQLARLCHAVIAPDVEERLSIQLSDIQLPSNSHFSVADLRCKAYVGPQAAVTEGPDGRPDKTKLRDVRLELHEGAATVEVEIGVPFPQEPWALRVKLYHRPASALFKQEKVAEVVEVVPRPASRVQLVPAAAWQRPGSAVLQVLRVVPISARSALKDVAGDVLVRAVSAGVEAEDVEDLCAGARELGPDTLLAGSASRALEAAAGMGKPGVVEKLLAAGVPATAGAARTAEKEGHLPIARTLLEHAATPHPSVPLLERAVNEQLPDVAELLLREDPGILAQLPCNDGAAARKAHAAGAWSVLAALLTRGDPMPAPARSLLNYALSAGHVGLAHACLTRSKELGDMEAALRTCLDHGRVEIVREALEVQWRDEPVVRDQRSTAAHARVRPSRRAR